MRLGWGWVGLLVTLCGWGCGTTDLEPRPAPEADSPAPIAPPSEAPPHEPPAPCSPVSCQALGKDCGEVPDGCGGSLQCGSCGEGQSCGGSGLANVCGSPPPTDGSPDPQPDPEPEPEPEPDHQPGPQQCRPYTCEMLGAECGWEDDDCGHMMDCGRCAAGSVCGVFTPGLCESCSSEPLPSELPLVHTGKTREGTVRLEWISPLASSGTYVITAVGTPGPVWMTIHRQPCNTDADYELKPVPGFPHRYTLGFADVAYIRLAFWSSGERDYELRIIRAADDERGRCGDQLDNDGDGAVDCGDWECSQSPECRGPAVPTP